MDKHKVIEAIHNLGGCNAAEEWSKGYDAGITAALDAIEKIPDTDNNTDLISRSELQSEIAKGVGECRIRAFEPSVNCILQIIHRLPAAGAQHGKWEEIEEYGGWGDTHYRCSVCGEEWYLEDGTPQQNNMNFCPRCGARMNLEGGDTNG